LSISVAGLAQPALLSRPGSPGLNCMLRTLILPLLPVRAGTLPKSVGRFIKVIFMGHFRLH
jgi:hypothetical protein